MAIRFFISIVLLAFIFCSYADADEFFDYLDAKAKATFKVLDDAEKGDAEAQVKAGNMYRRGYPVDRDFAKAKSYFELAASQGNGEALAELGNLYYYVAIMKERALLKTI